MPGKKNNKQQRRGKRSRRSGGVTGLQVVKTIFPPMFYGTLTFSEFPGISNLAAGVGSYSYRLNSLYDPNFTGTGTTANGITQLAQLYDRYRVLSVKITLDWNCNSGTGGEVYAVLSNQNALSTGQAAWTGQRMVWRRPIGPPGGNNIATAVISAPIHAVYGVPKQQVRNEDDFASVMGNNPNNQVYLHLGHYAPGAAGTSTVLCSVKIEYRSVFSLPLTPTP